MAEILLFMIFLALWGVVNRLADIGRALDRLADAVE